MRKSLRLSRNSSTRRGAAYNQRRRRRQQGAAAAAAAERAPLQTRLLAWVLPQLLPR